VQNSVSFAYPFDILKPMRCGVCPTFCGRVAVGNECLFHNILHPMRGRFEGEGKLKNLHSDMFEWLMFGQLIFDHIELWFHGTCEVDDIAIGNIPRLSLCADLFLRVQVNAGVAEEDIRDFEDSLLKLGLSLEWFFDIDSFLTP
jgi:hypothetical protein